MRWLVVSLTWRSSSQIERAVFFSRVQKTAYALKWGFRVLCPLRFHPGGGLRIWKGWGCSSEILISTPKGDRSGRGPSFFWPLKETMLKHRQYIYIYFYTFSLATLNETFTAKYDGVLPRAPYKWGQNPKFTPLTETTSIPTPFIWGAPPRGGISWPLIFRDSCQVMTSRSRCLLLVRP